jgi:hypothetical protein
MKDEAAIEKVRRSVATVPWNRLAHAYHGASDAPAKLESLLAEDTACEDAIDWLSNSILHQGSVYSASTPVIWILMDLLSAWPTHPHAASLLRGLKAVTDVIPLFADEHEEEGTPVQQNWNGEPVYECWVHKDLPTNTEDAVAGGDYFKAAIVTRRQLEKLARHSLKVIPQFLDHSVKSVRTAAVAASLSVLRAVPDDAAQLRERMNLIGDARFDPGAWASAAMVLGQMGSDFTGLLDHPDRRVRLAAAMSPSSSQDSRGLRELAASLSEPEWLETEFPNGAAHLSMQFRFYVLAALFQRVKSAEAEGAVVEAVCTLIRKRASRYTVELEWGPMLSWLFPERVVNLPRTGDPAPLPQTLTATQRAVVQTLCDKRELWDKTNGTAGLAFMRVQLPFNRAEMQKLAAAN